MNKARERSNLLIRLGIAVKSIAKLTVMWLLLMVFFRLVEICGSAYLNGTSDNMVKIIFVALLQDFMFWAKYLWLAFVIFIPFYLLYIPFGKTLLKVVITLYFIIQLLLSSYFITAFVPLGADVFGYSLHDIKQTVGASGSLSISSAIAFVVLALFVVISVFVLSGKLRINRFAAVLLPIISVILVVSGLRRIDHDYGFKSDFENNLVTNKSEFFYSAAYFHFFPQTADSYSNGSLAGAAGSNFKYLAPKQYPFLHKEVAKDVLSPFFKDDSLKRPNIVIILVEGLGRAFTNEGAYLGNFTPFIDSLSKQSLYWNNFLSQGGRTFAVLPSLLGSLPFAKNGFLEMGSKMPPQLSLLNILKHNGYRTLFYSGADASFDNMAPYLRANNIDEIRDLATFPAGYQKLPAVNGFTWGYNDKELYRYYLESRTDTTTPQLSVLLTVSSHNPFMLNEPGKYNEMFEKRLAILKINEAQRKNYRKYKNQYASIMYTDDALRGFFDGYSKRPDFQNTIFLITGDHRMPEIPMSTKIDRYHVPLLIYSPKLSRTAQIASVSTHSDIAPSILAFLRAKYKISTPEVVSWIGEGLDTVRAFRNVHKAALIQNKIDIIDFIEGNYHLNGDKLFRINADLGETPVNDSNIRDRLANSFRQFKRRNSSIANGSKILPDSVYRKFSN